jgi:translocation and assembly module TamA
LQLGLQHEDTDSYDSKSIYLGPEYVHSFVGEGDSLYSLGRGSLGSAYVQFRVESFTVGDEEGVARLVMPGVRFMRRQYDEMIRPTKGYGYGLELRGATQYLGSNSNFLQFQWSGNMLVSLPFRFGLLLKAQGGTTLTNSFDSLPPSVRFFAGGETNVRGYAWQSLGPTDASGNVIGGKHLLTGTVELEKAIGKIFGVAAFYDVGNAFDSYFHMNLQPDAGIGVRLYTPLGAMRLDLARQVLGFKVRDLHLHFFFP